MKSHRRVPAPLLAVPLAGLVVAAVGFGLWKVDSAYRGSWVLVAGAVVFGLVQLALPGRGRSA